MADEVKLPGIGEVKKGYVYAGAGLIGVIVIYVYIKRKNAANAAASTTSSGTVTDPAGNVCAALDPASGYCPGSPEDEQYQEQASAGLGGVGEGYDEYPGGGAGESLITDAEGNTCVALDPSTGLCPVAVSTGTGTTSVTTNAQWVVEAEEQLGNTSTIQAALGYALSGSPITPAQKNIFMEAVGLLGPPPQGYPPLNVQGSSGSPPATGTSQVTVPGVVNKSVNDGEAMLTAAGLVPNVNSGGPRNPAKTYIIWSQTPGAGKRVAKGSRVDLAIKET